ncbi:hypothetical protein QGP82_09025 [Leptothoe sp. LEGE 181152]|nr:hypothetical protein [Leptothoe sp. LEGE 181152]
MTSNIPDFEADSDSNKSDKNDVRQDMSGSPKGNQQSAYASSGNVFQLNAPDAQEVYVGNACDFLEKHPILDPKDRILHYILILLSLSFYLIIWSIGGLFAKTKFPVKHVFNLLWDCIEDPKKMRKAVSNDIKNLHKENLRKDKSKKSKEEYIRLSQKRNRLFLDKKILKFLYRVTESSNEPETDLIRNIERLESRIDLDLEPLRKEYDPVLYKAQKVLDTLLGEKNAAEKDLENIRNSLRHLIEKYNIYSELPSQDLLLNLVSDLENNIKGNPYSIRAENLKTLESVNHLLQWFSYLIENDSDDYIEDFEPDFEPDIQPDIYSYAYLDSEPDILFESQDEPQIKYHEEPSESLDELDEQIELSVLEDELPILEDTDESYQDYQDSSEESNDENQMTGFSKDFLYYQLELLLSSTMNEPHDSIERMKLGIKKNWIKEVSVYGFKDYSEYNSVDIAVAAISLSIDNEHKNRIICIDGEEVNNLEKAIQQFKLVIRKHNNITLGWRITCTDFVYENAERKADVYKKLNIVDGTPISWTSLSWLLDVTNIRKIFNLPGFSVSLNFGQTNYRNNATVGSDDSAGCWVLVLVVMAFIFLMRPPGSEIEQYSPDEVAQPTVENISPAQEQYYMDDLHKSIAAWDIQSAKENLIILSNSSNMCLSQLSTKLQDSLNNRGAEGFRDVNPIMRSLNKELNCNLKIVPYEFSP